MKKKTMMMSSSSEGCTSSDNQLRKRMRRDGDDEDKKEMTMMEYDESDNKKNIIISSRSRRSSPTTLTRSCGGGAGGGLVSYDELPEYMKDNQYILNYYRAEWSLTQALFSFFRWHNETLNVWTHFLGFILFLVLTIANAIHGDVLHDQFPLFVTRHLSATANISHNSYHFFPLTNDPKPEASSTQLLSGLQQDELVTSAAATTWPFFVFLSGSMFCLLSSSVCHLFCCHSHHFNTRLLQMDYVGITVMIITSFFPPIYYIFQCSPHWQFIYLAGITIMGISTIFTLLSPAFSSGKYRSFRALLFVSMGLFGLIPAIHALAVNWSDPQRDIILAYESLMALSYLIGTLFYISRIPERWMPGWFDLAGHSHQIFHVFVMCGALAHYAAARLFLQYRSTLGCELN